MKAMVVAILMGLVMALTACSSGPRCGDGVVDTEEGEACDDGNSNNKDFCLNTCVIRPTRKLTVKWAFNADAERKFTGDPCIDVGAREIEVEIEGPSMASDTQQCSFGQIVFPNLGVGSYTVRVNPLDGNGESLARPPSDTIELDDFGEYQLTVNVPPEAWMRSYTGALYFRVGWGEERIGCAAAGVAMQKVRLTRDGAQLGSQAKDGAPLNGSEAPCYDVGEREPQTVLDLPFGPVRLEISGLDVNGVVTYQGSFERFVGISINNPTFRLVPTIPE